MDGLNAVVLHLKAGQLHFGVSQAAARCEQKNQRLMNFIFCKYSPQTLWRFHRSDSLTWIWAADEAGNNEEDAQRCKETRLVALHSHAALGFVECKRRGATGLKEFSDCYTSGAAIPPLNRLWSQQWDFPGGLGEVRPCVFLQYKTRKWLTESLEISSGWNQLDKQLKLIIHCMDECCTAALEFRRVNFESRLMQKCKIVTIFGLVSCANIVAHLK